jgi:hypothetical protein
LNVEWARRSRSFNIQHSTFNIQHLPLGGRACQ